MKGRDLTAAPAPVKLLGLLGLCATLLMTSPGRAQDGATAIDRTSLPVPGPQMQTFTELDVRDTEKPAAFAGLSAPDGAPNVVLILIDDIGYGAPSAFGGPIRMPNIERLAAEGVRFNHFHTTALCSPTRVALQSGRNHHTANMGNIMEWATGYPGYTGRRPEEVAFLAEILRLNGYSTAHIGKAHETAAWEVSPVAPSTGGRPARAMTAFTGSSPGRRINGTRRSMIRPR